MEILYIILFIIVVIVGSILYNIGGFSFIIFSVGLMAFMIVAFYKDQKGKLP
jgi:hypothetical protein